MSFQIAGRGANYTGNNARIIATLENTVRNTSTVGPGSFQGHRIYASRKVAEKIERPILFTVDLKGCPTGPMTYRLSAIRLVPHLFISEIAHKY